MKILLILLLLVNIAKLTVLFKSENIENLKYMCSKEEEEKLPFCLLLLGTDSILGILCSLTMFMI